MKQMGGACEADGWGLCERMKIPVERIVGDYCESVELCT